VLREKQEARLGPVMAESLHPARARCHSHRRAFTPVDTPANGLSRRQSRSKFARTFLAEMARPLFYLAVGECIWQLFV